jgi:hypothetical protein
MPTGGGRIYQSLLPFCLPVLLSGASCVFFEAAFPQVADWRLDLEREERLGRFRVGLMT